MTSSPADGGCGGLRGWLAVPRLIAAMIWAIPLLAIFASIANTLILGLIAAAALSHREVRAATFRLVLSPIGGAALAFLGWYLVSVAWSPLPRHGLLILVEALLIMAGGALLMGMLAGAPLPMRSRYAALVAISGAIFLVLFLLGMSACHWLPLPPAIHWGQKDELCVREALWRSSPLLGLAALPYAVAIRHRFGWPACLVFVAVAGIGLAVHFRFAGVLGFVVALLVFGLVRAVGRVAARLVGAAIALWILVAPSVFRAILSAPGFQAKLPGLPESWQERVFIWTRCLELIAENPIFGKGLGFVKFFSRVKGETVTIYRADGPDPWLLKFTDGHSNWINLRLETGLVGALLLAALLLAILCWLTARGRDRLTMALGMGLMAGVATIGTIGLNPIYDWWLTTIWSCILLIAAVTLGIRAPAAGSAPALNGGYSDASRPAGTSPDRPPAAG
jgi:hypothetical protein